MSNQSTFVLIHGSWHDGSSWSEVRTTLEAEGHRVHTPTLPGNGPGADPTVTMAQTAAAVTGLLTDLDLRDVTLVGHSFGGAVAQLVAQQCPDRLRCVIFHNAYVIEDSRSVLSYVPEAAAAAFASLAAPDGTLALPLEFFQGALMNDAPPDLAEQAWRTLRPEPLGRSAEELDLHRFFALEVPMRYVFATDDQVFGDPAFWHPGMSNHLPACEVVELPGSHEVLFSNPRALADALVRAAHV